MPPADSSDDPPLAPGPPLAAGAALGVAADVLFHGERVGVNVPLFVLLWLGLLYAAARRMDVRPARRNLWLLVPLVAAAAFAAVRASAVLGVLNLAAAAALAGLAARFFRGGAADGLTGRGYVVVAGLAWAHALVRPVGLLAALRPPGAERKPLRAVVLPVVRGVVLALPLLVVLGFLLASADWVFAQLMKDLLSFRIPPALAHLAGRLAVAAGVAWLGAGLTAHALAPAAADDADLRADAPRPPSFRVPYLEAASALAALVLLLALFVWVQFTYLFGGGAAAAEAGYTYAEYARRGFLDLVVVSLVTFAVVLSAGRRVNTDTPRRASALRGLEAALVVLTGVVLASAFVRLGVYADAFGYTRLRLYGHVAIPWIGAALAWLLFTRFRPGRAPRFGVGALACVLGFVFTLDALDPDARIARRNLAPGAAAPTAAPVDVRYLTNLSDDAVPVLAEALPRLDERDADRLRRDLDDRRDRLADPPGGRPSANLARTRARRALDVAAR